MAEEPHQTPAQGTTYGRQKGKWSKHTTPEGGHEGPSPRIIVAAVLAIILLVFILRNGHPIRVNFLFFSWDTTVRWLLFITILLGIALDRLVIWGMGRRKHHDGSEQKDDDHS
jgi:uncharacterized integral membrane protein